MIESQIPLKKHKQQAPTWFVTLLAIMTIGTLVVNAAPWRSSLFPENWTPPAGQNFYTDAFLQDWSYAGYGYGQIPIPAPSGTVYDVTKFPYYADRSGNSDATTAIQGAIDTAKANGGGVVYLPTGTYKVAPPSGKSYALLINSSHIVLQGDGEGKTFILNTSYLMRSKKIISVEGSGSWNSATTSKTLITSDLMGPTTVIPVASTGGYNIGDVVLIRNYAVAGDAWVIEHKMDGYWSDPVTQTGIQGTFYCRKVTGVDATAKTITVDIPTRYALKTRDGSAVVRFPSMLSEVGLRDFSLGNLQHPSTTGWEGEDYLDSTKAAYDVHASYAINFTRVNNGYIKNVASFRPSQNISNIHLLSNGILLDETKNVSVENCLMAQTQYGGGGGNAYAYRIQANESLFKNNTAQFARHGFTLSHMKSSGNVFFQNRDIDVGYQVAPRTGALTGWGSDHHMWFTHANLTDSASFRNSNFVAAFRGYGGTTHHGLTSAHSAFWNIHGEESTKAPFTDASKDYAVWSQQARYGYVVGTSGMVTKVNTHSYSDNSSYITDPVDRVEGVASGQNLVPQSLYISQLTRRVGQNNQEGAGFLAATPSTVFSAGMELNAAAPSTTMDYTLKNIGQTPIDWTATKSHGWLSLSASGGTLAAGASVIVTASIYSSASSLTAGNYMGSIAFTNVTHGFGSTSHGVILRVEDLRILTATAANGSVTLSPAGGTYDVGTQVRVAAVPHMGYRFVSWSGAATDTTNPIWLTMDADKSITANISALPFNVFEIAGTFDWVCPAGVTSITVECRGGGGAAGSAKSTAAGGTRARSGGGAGGSYARSIVSVTPGATYKVTVGAGGSPVSNVTSHNYADLVQTGGSSTFASDDGLTRHVLAIGGAGGGNALKTTDTDYNAMGGLGSVTGCIGDWVFAGGNGGSGAAGGSDGAGAGGGGAGDSAPGGNASSVNLIGAGGVFGGGEGGRARGATGEASSNGPTAPGGATGGVNAEASGQQYFSGPGAVGKVRLIYSSNFGIQHYAVQGASSQTAGVPFQVTITARDGTDAPIIEDAPSVTVSGSPGSLIEFDWNGDGAYGDNSGVLVNGVATITARNKKAETVSIVAEAGAITTTNPLSVTTSPAPFARLQVLLPGEIAAPGSITGKSGAPVAQGIGLAFDLTVNAVDEFWNRMSSGDTVGITSTDPAAMLLGNAPLVAGTRTFSVGMKTVGVFTLTATDVSDGTKPAATTPGLSIERVTLVWKGNGSTNQWTTDASVLNWITPSSAASAYGNGNFVVFDDTSAQPSVDIQGLVTPASLTVSSSGNHTFGSTSGGSMAGTTSLNHSGTGTLILATTNSYSGGTILTNTGAVRATANQALGSGRITIGSNSNVGRLELGGGISLSNAIAFHSRLSAAPSQVGIQNISGNNTLSGTITLTTGGSGYSIQSDADLLTLGTASQTAISYITGTRLVSLQGAGNGIVAGNIVGGDSSGRLTKAGAGTWMLAGNNTYSVPTVVSAGTLALSQNGTITNSPSLNIFAGAAFNTTAKAHYVIHGTRPVTFGINATGAGTSGMIAAAGLDISAAVVTYNITGTSNDPVYVLATYTSLSGTPSFASAPAPPAGYTLAYAFQGNKIALVSDTYDPFVAWAGPGVPFDADSNQDSVASGLAWFLGADSHDENAAARLPTVSENAGFLVQEFHCLNAADRGAAVYEVQYGQLNDWSGTVIPGAPGIYTDGVVDFVITDPEPAGGLLKVVATIPDGEASGGRLFSRIKGVK